MRKCGVAAPGHGCAAILHCSEGSADAGIIPSGFQPRFIFQRKDDFDLDMPLRKAAHRCWDRMRQDVSAEELMEFFSRPLGRAFAETFQSMQAAHMK